MQQDVPANFVDLLTQHQPRLQSYIGSLLANQESTWDVLQETNRVLIEKHENFLAGTSFINWSLTVAQVQVKAWLRDQKRDRHILTPELADVFAQDERTVAWTNRDQKIAALEECFETLSTPNQELIRSRYSQDESLAEISTHTSKSVNSLKQIFFRVRNSLSSCIEERLQTQ
jgi:RNA polymerase sigma-70 factor